MSRFLKSLSSLVNRPAGRTSDRDTQAGAPESDAGPSTLTTPLFPLNGSDAEAPSAPPRHASSTAGADAVPRGALVPLTAQPAPHKTARKSGSSRALNAVVRATTQVTLPTHVEPTPQPKVTRAGHRSQVLLTETEKLRLQIMQVQLKLTGLGLYEGAIDGMMNPDLVDGVRHFQTLKGMRDSGLLTTGTLAALGIRALD